MHFNKGTQAQGYSILNGFVRTFNIAGDWINKIAISINKENVKKNLSFHKQ